MSERLDRHDLITRLEQAEAGSRELDAVFARVVAKPSTLLNGMTYDEALDRFPNDLAGIARNWPIPAYTTSLDAIVALIGEKLPDVHMDLFARPEKTMAELWYAEVHRAQAKTAPLALAAALLRAIKEGADG